MDKKFYSKRDIEDILVGIEDIIGDALDVEIGDDLGGGDVDGFLDNCHSESVAIRVIERIKMGVNNLRRQYE